MVCRNIEPGTKQNETLEAREGMEGEGLTAESPRTLLCDAAISPWGPSFYRTWSICRAGRAAHTAPESADSAPWQPSPGSC